MSKNQDIAQSLNSKLEAEQVKISLSLVNLKEIRLAVYQKQIEELGTKSNSLIISSDDGMKAATELASKLKEIGDELDKRRVELKAPGKTWADAVDEAFQPLIKRSVEFVKALRTKAEAYRQKLLDEKTEAERKAREAAEKLRREAEQKQRDADAKAEALRLEADNLKKKDAAKAAALREKAAQIESVAQMQGTYAEDRASKLEMNVPVAQAMTTSASGKTAIAKEKWAFEIIKREAVPMDYWEINEAMIQSVIDSQVKSGKMPEIAGCRCFKKASVAFGGR